MGNCRIQQCGVTMSTKLGKLTASVPEELISTVNQIAREQGISRSKLISLCLDTMAKKREKELLSEGYREMASDNEEFVAYSGEAAFEVLDK